MTKLGRAVELFNELNDVCVNMTMEEYDARVLEIFQETTGYQIIITQPKMEQNFFDYYNYLVRKNGTPFAKIYINSASPDEETIQIIKLVGLVLGNKKVSVFYEYAHKEESTNEIPLTFTDAVALKAIFADYRSNQWVEAKIITSKIADENELSRSGVCNACRKLAAAGIIKTFNCGAHGTKIQILSPKGLVDLLDSLEK